MKCFPIAFTGFIFFLFVSQCFGESVSTAHVLLDWQHQYETIINQPRIVQASWVKVTPATNTSEIGSFVFASTPEGKLYLKTIHPNDPSQDETLAFDGRILSVPVNGHIFNRLMNLNTIQKAVNFVYQTNYGFAFSPGSIILNPAVHSDRTPIQMGALVIGTKQYSDDSVELSFRRRDEDGLYVPSSILFTKVNGYYFPKLFIYNTKDGSTKVAFDEINSYNDYSLPAKYRYIVTTNSLNRKLQNLSSTTTYNLMSQGNVDENLFTLTANPFQIVNIEKPDGHVEVIPASVIGPQNNKSGLFPILVTLAVLFSVSGWVVLRRMSKKPPV